MNYLTVDMAKAAEVQRPYTNLKTYLEYKQRGVDALAGKREIIEKLSAEDEAEASENQELIENKGDE